MEIVHWWFILGFVAFGMAYRYIPEISKESGAPNVVIGVMIIGLGAISLGQAIGYLVNEPRKLKEEPGVEEPGEPVEN